MFKQFQLRKLNSLIQSTFNTYVRQHTMFRCREHIDILKHNSSVHMYSELKISDSN